MRSGQLPLTHPLQAHQLKSAQYLLTPQHDFVLVAKLEIEQAGVGLAHQPAVVELDLGHVVQAAAGFPLAVAASNSDSEDFGFHQRLMESGENKPLTLLSRGFYCGQAILMENCCQKPSALKNPGTERVELRRSSNATTFVWEGIMSFPTTNN